MAGVTAIVPLNALGRAKGRLADDLAPETRVDLVAWMLGRVVAACDASRAVSATLVVAGDDDAAALATGLGAQACVQPRKGLAAALEHADMLTARAPATLVLAADLPLATGSAVDAVCAAGARGPCVVVVPTADGGTGALLRTPPGVIVPAYGRDSAAAHIERARAAGARAIRLRIDALALDVDTADGLRAAGLETWLR
jgi:2-phospho-L-lactate guanylyltransferase